MKILRVYNTSMYDVFVGNGWKNWARYGVSNREGEVRKLDGNITLSKDQETTLMTFALLRRKHHV